MRDKDEAFDCALGRFSAERRERGGGGLDLKEVLGQSFWAGSAPIGQ
jgi:hypothetical protein